MFNDEELEYLKKILCEKREVLRENWNETDEKDINITEGLLSKLINMSKEELI